MSNKQARGLFITGTDTGVGKTFVGRIIAKSLVAAGHRVGVYKPAESGCRREGDGLIASDATTLWKAAGEPGKLEDVCPQRFEAALAPHIAARAEGKEIDCELLRSGLTPWRENYDIVLVEGAGGLMSPMSDDDYNATLAEEFGYPIVVVAPNALGGINQTLQTLITAVTYGDGLDVAGIVLNRLREDDEDMSLETNRREIASRSTPPILAEAEYLAVKLDKEIDWFALAGGESDSSS